jgi:2-iminobutanoate/2-iminopropanoate deaminase
VIAVMWRSENRCPSDYSVAAVPITRSRAITRSLRHLCYSFLDTLAEAIMSFTRDVVSTPNAPKAIGPYSQAIRANGFIFVSGQVAFDPATRNIITGGIEEQTEQVLKNLAAILAAAGSSWEKAVKTTVFLQNMSEFGQMNGIYEKFCKNAPPARSTVEVARLPKDVSVEIDVIALA